MNTVPAYRSGWDTVYRVPVVKGNEKKNNSSNKSTPQKKKENKRKSNTTSSDEEKPSMSQIKQHAALMESIKKMKHSNLNPDDEDDFSNLSSPISTPPKNKISNKEYIYNVFLSVNSVNNPFDEVEDLYCKKMSKIRSSTSSKASTSSSSTAGGGDSPEVAIKFKGKNQPLVKYNNNNKMNKNKRSQSTKKSNLNQQNQLLLQQQQQQQMMEQQQRLMYFQQQQNMQQQQFPPVSPLYNQQNAYFYSQMKMPFNNNNIYPQPNPYMNMNSFYSQQINPTFLPPNFYSQTPQPIITQQSPPIIYHQQDIYHTQTTVNDNNSNNGNILNPEDEIIAYHESGKKNNKNKKNKKIDDFELFSDSAEDEEETPKFNPPRRNKKTKNSIKTKTNKSKIINENETIETNIIHKENIIKDNGTKEVKSAKAVLLDQIEMLYVAEEITTYEKSILDELALVEDPEVIVAVEEYIKGIPNLLVNILHRKDNYMLSDEEIAKILANDEKQHNNSGLYTSNMSSSSSTTTTRMNNASRTIRQANSSFQAIVSNSSNLGFTRRNRSSNNSTSLYDNAAILKGEVPIPTLTELMANLNNYPPIFRYQGNLYGNVLKRTPTLKVFLKWNRIFYCIDNTHLTMWRSLYDWYNDGPIYNQVLFHGLMYVSAIVRKSYDGIQVYTFKLLENPHSITHNVSQQQYTQFNANAQVKVVAKFGSTHIGLIEHLREELLEMVFRQQQELEKDVRDYLIN